MEGFFSKKEIESPYTVKGKITSCVSCGKHLNCKSPKFESFGEFKRKIMNIFSMPNEVEDRTGIALKGRSYTFVDKKFKEFGISLFDDCINIYAVRCHTKGVSDNDISFCRKEVFKLIDSYKPEIIILHGEIPTKSIIEHRWKNDFGKFEKWQGWTIPDQDLQSWLCPIYSHEGVLDGSDVYEVIYTQNLEKIFLLLNKSFKKYDEPEIIYLEELSALNKIKSGVIAFDYETTGLKPYAQGHKIICCSIAVNRNKVFTFMFPGTKEERKPFIELMNNPGVLKIAANLKMEDNWTNVRLRTEVKGWFHDTMQAAHIIDNRRGITGLKFQTYINYGIIDYSSEISNYLKASEKDSNAKNKIEELVKTEDGRKKLLKYCAYDSIYEYRLYEDQKIIHETMGETEISPENSNFPNAYALFHRGIQALAKAERHGLRIDTKYIEEKQNELEKKIQEIEKQVTESKFYRHWEHSSQGKVNLNSGTQLANFLYNVKKIKPVKTTSSGKGSTDEEALRMLDIPECNMILERSKLRKIKDTYLKSFYREQINGVMHPVFNLHLAVTFRSSSDSPNFQNIPRRDEFSMNIVRRSIFPRKDCQLLELDYKAIEVGVAACYHKDKNMLKYLRDLSTDMHADMSSQIFCIDNYVPDKEHKYLRNAAKNSFVFPQFYGDYYKNNAVGICNSWVKLPLTKWKKTEGVQINGITLSEHLINHGIKSYQDFEDHIKTIEKHFWTKRFPQYAEWKEIHYANYLKTGYVSLLTGFVCKGVMSRNDAINYPVQGAAFHLLLWLVIKLTEYFEENHMKTRVVGQIHDAVILDVWPPEKEKVREVANKIGTKDIVKEFPWIIIPLVIEADLCPVNGSWAEKKEWK